MPNYTVRVELKGNPTFQQYEALHSLMAGFGLYQTVTGISTTSGASDVYSLPHATYYGQHSATAAGLRTLLAATIQARIQRGIIVFVAETVDWALHYS